MSLFDTHCHLDDARFEADRDEVVARANAMGVTRMLVPGVSPTTWEALAALKARHSAVCVAIGLHPYALVDMDESTLSKSLDDLAAAAQRLGAVAIGEVGFDGIVAKERGVSFETQTRVVDTHVEVARALNLPLILHVYRAQEVALRALSRHGTLRGVVHSYSGSAELVPRWIATGLHLSFAGAVTKSTARRPLEAARAVPSERLLVETDAPDQVPENAGSERCEPKHLIENIRALATARNTTEAQLGALTADNARALFAF